MSGRKSRSKGYRGEYEVRDYFRKLGYTADRVPSSGAAEGFKGDVRVKSTDNHEFLVEVKRRKKSFSFIYALAEEYLHWPICFFYKNQYIDISTSYDDLANYIKNIPISEFTLKQAKAVNRLLKLRELLGEAKYLVVRDDNMPWVFISYR